MPPSLSPHVSTEIRALSLGLIISTAHASKRKTEAVRVDQGHWCDCDISRDGASGSSGPAHLSR